LLTRSEGARLAGPPSALRASETSLSPRRPKVGALALTRLLTRPRAGKRIFLHPSAGPFALMFPGRKLGPEG